MNNQQLAETLIRVRRDMISDGCRLDLIGEIEVVICELSATMEERLRARFAARRDLRAAAQRGA